MGRNLNEKIVKGAWFYGGVFGAMPPYIYTLVVIAANPSFRWIYFLRLAFAVVAGALVGGFTASKFSKYGLKILKKNLFMCLFLGIILGAISGALTFLATSAMFLIASSDYSWAINIIKRSVILGIILGGIAGGFFGGAVYSFLKK